MCPQRLHSGVGLLGAVGAQVQLSRCGQVVSKTAVQLPSYQHCLCSREGGYQEGKAETRGQGRL